MWGPGLVCSRYPLSSPVLSSLALPFPLFSALLPPSCSLPPYPFQPLVLYTPVPPHPMQPLFLSSLLLASNPLSHSLCSRGMDSIGIWPSTAPCTAILHRLVRLCHHCHALTVRVV